MTCNVLSGTFSLYITTTTRQIRCPQQDFVADPIAFGVNAMCNAEYLLVKLVMFSRLHLTFGDGSTVYINNNCFVTVAMTTK